MTWSMPLRIMTNSVALPAVASGTSMTSAQRLVLHAVDVLEQHLRLAICNS